MLPNMIDLGTQDVQGFVDGLVTLPDVFSIQWYRRWVSILIVTEMLRTGTTVFFRVASIPRSCTPTHLINDFAV